MFGKTHFKSASALAGAIVLGTVVLGSPARAESGPITVANTDNRTVTVTAYDMNAGGHKIFGETLKHNEQKTDSMVLDELHNGRVKVEATAVDAKGGEKKCSEERKQLSRGYSWSVRLTC